MKDCQVYLIAHVTEGGVCPPVKCGISASPWSRLKSLQTGSPRELEMLGIFALPHRDVAKVVESDFHRRLSAKRLSGEWFDVTPLEAVETLCECLVDICRALWKGDDMLRAVVMTGAHAAHQRCLQERALREGRGVSH